MSRCVRAWIALLSCVLLSQPGMAWAASGWMSWLKDSMSRPAPMPVVAYSAQNVFKPVDTLPKEIRRVAVLPLTIPRNDQELLHGQENLEPFLEQELHRKGAFEWVQVTTDQLRLWTGQSRWSEQDELPRELFERIRENLGCDGVLFSRLTVYRADAPMQMGWKFRLVSVRPESAETVYWAADEAFDSADPIISKSAARHAREMAVDSGAITPELARFSPQSFGRFTLQTLLGTLPGSTH